MIQNIEPLDLQHSAGDLDSMVLRQAFSCFPSGVVGICGAVPGPDGPTPVGMAASSFVSVSVSPPLVAFCVQWTSTTWPRLERLPRLGISVLGENHDHVAGQLASKTADRFAGLSLRVTSGSAIFIEGASAWLECSVKEVLAAGDHGIVLMTVNGLTMSPNVEPLVFHGSAFRSLQSLAG